MVQNVYKDTKSLVDDALFRAGEIPGASEWDDKALEYINREYRMLCTGASEFLPEIISDWWWLRANGVLTLDPVFSVGSANIVSGSSAVVLSAPPAYSLLGWRFKTIQQPDAYNVIAHTAGNPNVTLDSPYTGPTDTGAVFQAMHVVYTLNSAVSALISPIAGFRANPRLYGLAPERMDEIFPLSQIQNGIPQAFALENEQQIRMSHGGRTDGTSMRMEYRYRPSVEDLTYDTASIPLVPIQFRHVLSDMTLVYLYSDKNDDRLVTVGTSVRSALGAMAAENRRRITKIDWSAGKIFPRAGGQGRNYNRLLRTESGLIIG